MLHIFTYFKTANEEHRDQHIPLFLVSKTFLHMEENA